MTPQQTTNNKQQTPRSSNIELLRIITMLLIVMYHYVGLSGLLDPDGVVYQNSFSWRSLFLLVCGAWGKVGINCFVFITGYYMCRSHISLRKFLKLISVWLFYEWTIYFIFVLFHYEEVSFDRIISILFPFRNFDSSFVPCFVLFFLFIPFMNILLRHLNEKQHIRLIALCSFIYVIIGSIPSYGIAVNYISYFMVLYFISAFVRLYPKGIFNDVAFWRRCTFLTILISVVSILGIYWIKGYVLGKPDCPYFLVRDSNKVLAVLPAFSVFMYFKNMKLKYNPFINLIAASTFGVLLIHCNSWAMNQWLWSDMLNVVGYYDSPYMPLHIFGSVVGVFFACVLIDQIRIAVIEKPFFRFWDAHWEGFQKRWKQFEDKIWTKLGVEVKK